MSSTEQYIHQTFFAYDGSMWQRMRWGDNWFDWTELSQNLKNGTMIYPRLVFHKSHLNNSSISNSFYIPTNKTVSLIQVDITGVGVITSECVLISEGNGYYRIETSSPTVLEYGALAYIRVG